MKTARNILIVIGLLMLAVAPMLIKDAYDAHRCQEEVFRLNDVKAVVEKKVQAYYEANGRYPDSIDILSFTNSLEEIRMLPDLKKIRYRRTKSDYAVGWDGEYGASRH